MDYNPTNTSTVYCSRETLRSSHVSENLPPYPHDVGRTVKDERSFVPGSVDDVESVCMGLGSCPGPVWCSQKWSGCFPAREKISKRDGNDAIKVKTYGAQFGPNVPSDIRKINKSWKAGLKFGQTGKMMKIDIDVTLRNLFP
jgi:hypothetical protein